MLRMGGDGIRAVMAVVVCTGIALGACSSDTATTGGTNVGPGTDAGPQVTGDGGPRCKGTRGPMAVNVGGYCIDSTEVSLGQYREFLSAKFGGMSGQPPECQWNTTYAPKVDQTDTGRPVFGANWCSAFMYCQWAGKRLCGHVEGGGNVAPKERFTNADEWFRACTAEGTRAYPYGDAHKEEYCNGSGRDAPGAVGSKSECQGGFPGIFDMSGNLWEWENSCEDGDAGAGGSGAEVTCIARGGSFLSENDGSCRDETRVRRDLGDARDVTIRCCSDLE